MTRVHVWGASGYAAAEVIRFLDAHPFVDVGVLESASHAGESMRRPLSAPALDAVPIRRAGERCGARPRPATSSSPPVPMKRRAPSYRRCSRAGARVIDLSAPIASTTRAVYGLTEWYRDAIARRAARRESGLLSDGGAARAAAARTDRRGRCTSIVDAKSGITGAGRKPRVELALRRSQRRHSRLRPQRPSPSARDRALPARGRARDARHLYAARRAARARHARRRLRSSSARRSMRTR